MIGFDLGRVRAAFPALALADDGVPRAYLDAPAGTQVADRVLTRMRQAMVESCANDGGVFRTSMASEGLMFEAHRAAADFLGASSFEEIVFGLNTTSLLFSFSRMLSRGWRAGDNIVLTRMDHDANVAPWLVAAAERGVEVRWLDFDPEGFRYAHDDLGVLVDGRTRLVACNHASNLLGTVNDVRRIVEAARAVGAISVVDGVQSAPHMAIDVAAIGCDLFACSPYKFFGPHAGVLYVRKAVMDAIEPLKVRPSPDQAPWRFAPGTPSFEAQAGVLGAIEHIAWLGEAFGGAAPDASRRARIEAGWRASAAHERSLMKRFLAGLQGLHGARLFGLTGDNELGERVPTFSFTLPGIAAADAVARLAARNIFAWAGSFYAHEAAHRLGINPHGVIRVGLAHYTSPAEVDRVIAACAEL